MRVGGWLERAPKQVSYPQMIKLTSHHPYRITLQLHCSVVANALMLNIHLGFIGESNCYTFGDYQSACGASQVALVVKNPLASAGDVRDAGLTPESERSPGEGNGNPLQYSCLGNPMDRGSRQGTVHGVKKSWTWLKCLSTHAHRVLETGPFTDLSIMSINHSKCSYQLPFLVIMPPHL